MPPHLRRFLEVTLGFSWPESDDQGLTALWLAWADFEKAAHAYHAAATTAGHATAHTLTGHTGDFFSHYLTGTVGDSLTGLAESAAQLASTAKTAAADVYKTKVMFVVFAAFALATIIELLTSIIGALLTGPVIAAARISLAAIWKALVTRLATLTRPLLLRGLAEASKQTAKFTAIGVGLMTGTDFGVQAQQIADGLRDTFDTRSLAASTIGGALGGAFAGLFHAAAGLVRTTAFTLEGRIVTTTTGTATTKITGPQKVLGHLTYGTGQVGIALLTAPLINTLTGHPGANPFLGIISAFSAHGGKPHTTPHTHITAPPTLTIPTTDTKTHTPDTAEPHTTPPPYTTITTDEKPEPPEKTPAYTTSPQAVGNLFSTPAASAYLAALVGTGVAPTSTAVTSLAAANAPGRNPISSPSPSTAPGGTTATHTVASTSATPDVAHVATTSTATSQNPVPAASAGPAKESAPAPQAATAGVSITPLSQAAKPNITAGPTAFADHRTGAADLTRSTEHHVAQPRTERPAITNLAQATSATTPLPPRPDIISRASAEPVTETRLAATTAEFLTASADTPPHQHTPLEQGGTPLPASPSITAYSPLGQVKAIPLPGGGGAAFVADTHAANVLNAFPQAKPGVFRVVTHLREGYFHLPGDHAGTLPHRPAQLAEVLKPLLPQLAARRAYTEIELWACDLTPAHRDQLAPIVRAATGAELTFARTGSMIHIASNGDIDTTPAGVAIPELRADTLTLGGKRDRSANDSESSAKRPRLEDRHGPAITGSEPTAALQSAVTEGLLHHGDMDSSAIRAHLNAKGVETGTFQHVSKAARTARAELRQRAALWHPVHQGESRSERFDLANINAFTAFLYWQAATRTDGAEAIALSARAAGFKSDYRTLLKDVDLAIKAAEKDGRPIPILEIDDPAHRAGILARLDRISSTAGNQKTTNLALLLQHQKVKGEFSAVRKLVSDHKKARQGNSGSTANVSEQSAHPPRRRYLNRFLNADTRTDGDPIEKVAYMAAWADKSANEEQLVIRLREEGITGSTENLARIVSKAATEAAKNGDRLETLRAGDPAHREAIRSRVSSILLATPTLYPTGLVTRVVQHMRMRHIVGSQEELSAYATQLQQMSAAELLGDPSIHVDWDLRAIATEEKLDITDPAHHRTIKELAKRVVDDHGDLDIDTLVMQLAHLGIKYHQKLSNLIADAKEQAELEGSSWAPVFRGARPADNFSFSSLGDLTIALLQLAVDNPRETPAEIAMRAESAGLGNRGTLLEYATRAVEAAERHERRHPHLNITVSEHRPRIDTLIDTALSSLTSPSSESVIALLRAHNVRGRNEKIRDAVRKRIAELQQGSVPTRPRDKAGDPVELSVLHPIPLFRDLSLETDRPLLMKIAYATAWSDTGATPADVAARLTAEGVTGDPDGLLALATAAVAEATMSGDRLATLSATDPAQRAAVRARIGGILRSTPELHTLDGLTELVKHLRMRRITGPQEALRTQALQLLRIPHETLVADPTTRPEPAFGRITLHDTGQALPRLESALAVPASTMAESGYPSPTPSDGRGDIPGGPDEIGAPDDVAAMLWLLAVDRPHDTAAQIARLAESAGLTGHDDLARHAEKAIDAAARHRRRHPFLDISDKKAIVSIQSLVDALLIAEPDTTTVDSVVASLPGYNVTGDAERLRNTVRARKADLARTRKQKPDIYREFAAAAESRLPLRPERLFLGRTLDAGRASDQDMIAKLAYAAAVLDKEATIDELIARLALEGVTGDAAELRPLVVLTVAKADPHRTVSRPPHPTAQNIDPSIYRTIGAVLLANPALRDPGNTDRMTELLQLLRDRGITDAESVLREHAETMLAIRPDTPVRGAYSIPVASFGEPVRAVPIPGGVAFVHDTYARNVLNAFREPTPGTLRVVVPRDHTTSADLLLPGSVDALVRHDFAQLAEVIAGLPTAIAPWAALTKIELYSCDLSLGHGEDLTRLLHHHPHLHHVEAVVAHPGRPVYILPEDGIRTADDGQLPFGTLRLGPKGPKRPSGTAGESASTAKRPRTEGSGATGTTPADPEKQTRMVAMAIEMFHQHGDGSREYLAPFVQSAGFGDVNIAEVRKAAAQARQSMEESGALWRRHYAGAPRAERFDSAQPNHFTAWLWWQLATRPGVTGTTLVREAREAGFAVPYKQLLVEVQSAIKAAEERGRREPALDVRTPAHHELIFARLDRILADGRDRDVKDLTTALVEHNVRGESKRVSTLVRKHLLTLGDDPAHPTGGSSRRQDPGQDRTFLGRPLDVGDQSTRDLLELVVYAAASSDKTATPDELATRLQRENVAGDREALVRLVRDVVAKADYQGDRLTRLFVGDPDPGRQAELRGRALAIMLGTERLRKPENVIELVKHLRTRHVTGSQPELVNFATDLQQSADTPPADHATARDVSLAPLNLREGGPVPFREGDQAAIRAAARKVVAENGGLDTHSLQIPLNREGVRYASGFSGAISHALRQAKSDGSLWHPVHRGREALEYPHLEGFTPAEPNELTVMLWLLAVDYPRETPTEIARRAERTGFAGTSELFLAAEQAVAAAVRHGRRHPISEITDPAHRPRIDSLITALLRTKTSVGVLLKKLREYNVVGWSMQVERAVAERRKALAAAESPVDGEAGAPALPVLSMDATFAGRSLTADSFADHKAIGQLAYAAAVVHKDATVEELAARLATEGVTGSPDVVAELVAGAVSDAARNGDRLATLSIGDATHHGAIRSRIGGILLSTSHLHAPDRLTELVSHMRMRHIRGPQDQLESAARPFLEKSPDALLDDPSTQPERTFGPVARKIDHTSPEHAASLEALARKVVAEHGTLGHHALSYYLSREGMERKGGYAKALTAAAGQARQDGSAWHPVYQGVEQPIGSRHRDAVLWQLALDHPQATAMEIARRAQNAGFLEEALVVEYARETIDLAVELGHRHPVLHISNQAHESRIHQLIDALLSTEPGLGVDSTCIRLYEFNVRGVRNKVHAAVQARSREMAKNPPDAGAVAAAQRLLTLRPDRSFRGETMDAGNPSHRERILAVAYAAAWARKNATPDELVTWLTTNGVAGTPAALSLFATQAIGDATRHGDRLVPLSTDVPTYRQAIRQRTTEIVANSPELRNLDRATQVTELVRRMRIRHIEGPQALLRSHAEESLDALIGPSVAEIHRRTAEIVLANESLRDPENPHRVTELVEQMQAHRIAGSPDTLRAHAKTILALAPDETLPDAVTSRFGTFGVPVDSDGQPARAVPLPDGVAFITDTYAPNVLRAFSEPVPGIFNLVVHHRNGMYAIPGFRGGALSRTPEQLVTTLAKLPTGLADWSRFREIRLWACDLDSAHLNVLDGLIANPALRTINHLFFTPAYLESRIYITPSAEIRAVATGMPDPTDLPERTLVLGGKRKQERDSGNSTKRVRPNPLPISSEKRELLASSATTEYILRGDLGPELILGYIREDGITARQSNAAKKVVSAARKTLKQDDMLWQPVHRNKRISERFNLADINSLTAFMYWQAITQPENGFEAIVRAARGAGFIGVYYHITIDAKQAIRAAEEDGRRLRDDIREPVSRRRKNPRQDAETATSADELAASLPSRPFLGRSLDADRPGDRGAIEKIAYAAAWSDKTADAVRLATRLREEGIGGSKGNLTSLVDNAVSEAQKNGDRLEPLSTGVPAHRNAIQGRLASILLNTPGLHASGEPSTVVKHMRMRHITGDQDELTGYASQALGTPIADLLGDPTIHLDWELRPALIENKLDPQNPHHHDTIEALAQDVVHEFGALHLDRLGSQLIRKGVDTKTGTLPFLTRAKTTAESEGSLWGPIYRGKRRNEIFLAEAPNDLTVLLLQLAVDNPQSDAGRIAFLAEDAGFTGYSILLPGASEAIRIAEQHQRRHPLLNISSIEKKAQINTIIDAVVADNPDESVEFATNKLRSYNLQGEQHTLREAVINRKKELAGLESQETTRQDDAVSGPSRFPVLDPAPLFKGRSADIDRELIMKIAYAAAWADKEATASRIVARLEDEGISGSRESLTAMADSAIAEATMNGDRLPTLSSTDPGHREAVRARIGGILRSTPELRTSDRLAELVSHMRMRHITGPSEALRAQALVLLRIPIEELLADPTTMPDEPFGAITLHSGRDGTGPEPAQPGDSAPPSDDGAAQELSSRTDTLGEVMAMLWLLSVDHPRETAAQIARRAELAGLSSSPGLLRHAEDVIDAAVRNQRRYPFLDGSVSEDHAQIATLVNALIADTPDAKVRSILALLPSYNVAGDTKSLHRLVTTRKSDLARTRKSNPAVYQGVVRVARTRLHSGARQAFFGRTLHTGRAADRTTIEELAFAAARLNREAGTEELIARLSSEGVTGDSSTLTDLVVRARTRAEHRDLPTVPAVTQVLYQRIGEIMLANPRLRDRANPDRSTSLVQEMRARNVAGPQHILREHAETVLAVRPDEPLPGTFSVPVASPLGPVRAVPFPGGIAFVNDAYARNVLNAFPEPKPGTLWVVVSRQHRPGGAFTLPDFMTGTDIRHDLDQLAEVIASVPSSIAGWTQTGRIELLSCYITPGEQPHLTGLIRHRTGRHDIDLFVSHPGKPVFITPAGRIGNVDNGELPAGTLRLGPGPGTPELPAVDTPPLDVLSWRPGVDRTFRDFLVNQVVWPRTSRLAGLPPEVLTMVREQFQLDPALGSHLDAWVEAQYQRRSAGVRLPTFDQVAALSGDLVTARGVAEILARKVVDGHGNLTPAAVRHKLADEGIRHPHLLGPAITKALNDAEADGSAWHPTFRGEHRSERFDADEPGPATLLLWRLAVDHHRETTAGLALRAEQAGLGGRAALLADVGLAIDAAIGDQQRPLSATKPSDLARIHSLIDAILLTEPGISTPALVRRLRDDVQGGLDVLFWMVENRHDQLAREQELGLPAMDVETARALLSPHPVATVLGRVLDSGDAGQREIIGHLAYATAWTHKTDTVERLAERLREDGVTGPDKELTRLISDAVAEADRHGDRLVPLPADRPAFHLALRERIDHLVAAAPSLRDPHNRARLTQLVRQMRLNHVTGPQYLLTAHAHDALTRNAATPLGSDVAHAGVSFSASARAPQAVTGTHYQQVIAADGTITAVGFLPDHEASILHAAAARHDLATQLGHPGARLVFAHHDHTGYTIPHPTDPVTFFTTLDTTLTHLGTTWKHQDILLVTCLPNPTHTERIRSAAQELGYQGTIHTTTGPHTEITEHRGARPLGFGDTPHPNAIVLNPTSQTVTFAKGARDLMAGDWFYADHPAQRVVQLGESLYDGLLNAHESGGAIPAIEVHGYGNSRRPGRAMATSVARVDSVVVALLLGLNGAHQNRPVADRIPDFGLMIQAFEKIVHGRAGSPLSSGRDLEERRRGVFVRIPAFPLPAGRVPTFTYRNPSGVDVSRLGPLRFGSRDEPIRVPREFIVPPGPALALESPTGAMIFPTFLFAMGMGWDRIRKYQGVISLSLTVDHYFGKVVLRDGISLAYRDFATWVHEMLNGAPDSQRLLLLTGHGGEQPRRTGNQPGVPAASLAGILSSITHGRVLTPLTGTIWTYGGEAHANSWGLFQDGRLLGVHERPGTGYHTGTSVRDAVAAAGLESPRHPEPAQDVDQSTSAREEAAAAAAEAYINPPPPLPSASKPVKLPEQTMVKFSPESNRIELRYRNELERLFRQVYLHAQEAYDEAESFPQVVITSFEDTRSENASRSKRLGKTRARAIKDLAVQWMAKELDERATRRESTFDAGSPEENRSFLASFIRIGSRPYDGAPTDEVAIELFNLRETPEEAAGASSASTSRAAPSPLYPAVEDPSAEPG
ncbi:hypothetical protein DMC64_37280 [Amycolatopsis sp. WAC 04197]|nr:hypothetical protein DMC64_37280 [Amycolatopsis sp. WAC 04197]